MFTLNVLKKNCYLIMLIMIISLFAAIPIVYSDSNDNRYRDDSSSVFAPGYLNAAKYQAEVVINQRPQGQNKSLFSKAMDYVMGKTENKVEQAAVDKPRPVLQQKQSSGGKGNARLGTALSSITIPSNTNPADIPAYIRSIVQDYINKELKLVTNGMPDIRSCNGKYYAFLDSNKYQVFDSSGNALFSAPKSISDDGTGMISSIVSLSDGNLMVFIYNSSSMTAQIFDSTGNGRFDTPVSIISFSDPSIAVSIDSYATKLANGDIAVFWQEQDSSGTFSIKTRLMGSCGNMLSEEPVTITSGGNSIAVDNITGLANGSIALFWEETDPDNVTTLKYADIDPSGNTRYTTTLTGDTGFLGIDPEHGSGVQVISMSDGGVSVLWTESDQTDEGLFQNLEYQVFDSSGKGLLDTPEILTSSDQTLPWAYSASAHYVFAIPLSSGGTGIFWVDSVGAFDYQVVDSSGNITFDAPVVISQVSAWESPSFRTLANGGTMVYWNDYDTGSYGSKMMMLDSTGKISSAGVMSVDGGIGQVTELSNGNILILGADSYYDGVWTPQDGYPTNYVNYKYTVFDQSGNIISTAPIYSYSYIPGSNGWKILSDVIAFSDGIHFEFSVLSPYKGYSKEYVVVDTSTGAAVEIPANIGANIIKVINFPDGNIAVVWSEHNALQYQVFDPAGNSLLGSPGMIGNIGFLNNFSAETLADGSIALFFKDETFGFGSKIIDPTGGLTSMGTFNSATQNMGLRELGNAILSNPNIDPLKIDFSFNPEESYTGMGKMVAVDNSKVSDIFRALLSADNGPVTAGHANAGNPSLVDPSKTFALAIPAIAGVNGQDMEIVSRLASIMANPTEDQKVLLDVIKSLLADTGKIRETVGDKATNAALKKAEDNLLNMVANILLAQGVPDLLKKGDMSNIKAIFSELDNVKGKIMLEYVRSTKPYYENMLKDMAKNMAMLQSKNLLSPSMTREELDKLPPSELDKILEKIKNMKDKTFEEEYLLQQEAKYRKEYLDPNKKKLEEDMKDMMKNFTGRISDVLKSTEKK
jgi:hypothetical protein